MDHERARVHVADRVDQAHHPSRTAQVQARQRRAVAAQVEERVAGQHVFSVSQQPLVQPALLPGRRVQAIPHVGAPTRRAQPGQTELRAVAIGDRLECIELRHVLPGDDHRQLEADEAGLRQSLHGGDRGEVRARAPDRVVDRGGGPVERDLHVDVVGRRKLGRPLGRDARAVGRELHADVVRHGIVDELPEVPAHGRLAAADVDVEHLHALELVDHRHALGGGELARVPPP